MSVERRPDLVLVRVVVQTDPVLLQGQHVVVFGPDGKTDRGERGYHGNEKTKTGGGGRETKRNILNGEVAHYKCTTRFDP